MRRVVVGGAVVEIAVVEMRRRRLLAALGFAAVAALLAADSVGLSGLPLGRALDFSVLAQVARTSTGAARLVQLACCLAAMAVPFIAAPAAAIGLGVEALAGHPVVAPHPFVAEVFQGSHASWAAGVWIGGLAAVALYRDAAPFHVSGASPWPP